MNKEIKSPNEAFKIGLTGRYTFNTLDRADSERIGKVVLDMMKNDTGIEYRYKINTRSVHLYVSPMQAGRTKDLINNFYKYR